MEQTFCGNRQDDQTNGARPLAHYHPNPWGDSFLNHIRPTEVAQRQKQQEANKLKEEITRKLTTIEYSKERLIFIDAIEQLGVGYHFHEEIEAILQYSYDNYSHNEPYANDFHYNSLRFRLLRQHGFNVSCDVFAKFKNEDGRFKESLGEDVIGILNLYEASFLRVHGEEILDEATEFSTRQLKLLVGNLHEPLKTQVKQALDLPLHKNIIRLKSRYYISIYEAEPSHDETLLRFAKLDFNLLQSQHLMELRDLSWWWKNLGFDTKLPYTRDRIVMVYFWTLGVYYEPEFVMARAIIVKVMKMLSVMDDTYDAYGLFDELQVYTEAIQRWDKRCINDLPDYMKLTYETLLNTFQSIEQDLDQEGRSRLVPYARQLVKDHCRGYFQEAKWLHEKHVPTYDEYLDSAAIETSGTTLLSAVSFLGVTRAANSTEAFEWVIQKPKFVKASCTICRLVDDIASRKIERKGATSPQP